MPKHVGVVSAALAGVALAVVGVALASAALLLVFASLAVLLAAVSALVNAVVEAVEKPLAGAVAVLVVAQKASGVVLPRVFFALLVPLRILAVVPFPASAVLRLLDVAAILILPSPNVPPREAWPTDRAPFLRATFHHP